jgi:hypothetical protein
MEELAPWPRAGRQVAHGELTGTECPKCREGDIFLPQRRTIFLPWHEVRPIQSLFE